MYPSVGRNAAPRTPSVDIGGDKPPPPPPHTRSSGGPHVFAHPPPAGGPSPPSSRHPPPPITTARAALLTRGPYPASEWESVAKRRDRVVGAGLLQLVDGELAAGDADAGHSGGVRCLDVTGRVADHDRLGGRHRLAVD